MVVFFQDLEEVPDLDAPIGHNLRVTFPRVNLPSGLLELAAETNVSCTDSKTAFNIHAFSQGLGVNGVHFRLHGHVEGDQITHFNLTLRRKPKGEPPAVISIGSEKVGGYPAVLERVFTLFPSTVVDCEVIGEFITQRLPVSLTPKEKSFASFGLQHKSLFFKPDGDESDTAVELKVIPETKAAVVNITSLLKVTMGPSCIQEVCDVLWSKAKFLYDVPRK